MVIGAQLMIAGLALGSVYALVAIGFALVYWATGVFHFAHAMVFTLAAYLAAALLAAHVGFVPAVLATVLAVSGLGVLLDQTLYLPLQARRGADAILVLVASLGAFAVLDALTGFVWGTKVQYLGGGEGAMFHVGPIVLTPTELASLVLTPVLIVALHLILSRTRVGHAIRAMASDPEMVRILGIPAPPLRVAIYALASGFAGAGAVLQANVTGAYPGMGLGPMLTGATCVLFANSGNLLAATGLGLAIGVLQSGTSFSIGSTWQNTTVMVPVVALLALRAWQAQRWGLR